ncbi:guanine nucleotide exchange factor synembryn-domain-containing protein [Thamnocephalis sphaerospora]|uniref:Guanine nucleotide exchange factor synembryn-domain-containing protein n=1 Tax=Thamnocephalis sphaerospora TaxID=78915 RepID=A0A4P9XPY5_9FUNG|nr:guanine nucleotide exchange factor synembryn-domain-containing protein [Thamnocephalis sphaerospora]|eukprot:RKP08085.1 guanine nucleotide exchange factor synembryn-domain-containing protein [Thamnocephalis sphaerospora]
MERYVHADNRRAGGDLGDEAGLRAVLTAIEQAAATTGTSYAFVGIKQRFVEQLLGDLANDSVWSTWSADVRASALRALKVQCRERLGANKLFEPEISNLIPDHTIPNYSVLPPHMHYRDSEWEREAIKCVANTMLLDDKMRGQFANTGGVDGVCDLLQHYAWQRKTICMESKFIMLRLLFLITVTDMEQCRYLADDLCIATILEQFLQPDFTDAISLMATSECLKLLYNLLIHLPKTINTLGAVTPKSSGSRPGTPGRSASSSSQDSDEASEMRRLQQPPSSSSSSSSKSKSSTLAKLHRRFLWPASLRNSSRRSSTDGSQTEDEEERKRKDQERIQRRVAIRFERLLPPILALLLQYTPTPADPLGPPTSHAIHALLHFPVDAFRSVWFPATSPQPYAVIDRLITVTDLAVSERNLDGGANERKLDEPIMPLITLLMSLARGDAEAKRRIKHALVPETFDRSKPVHKGDALSARIIRCLTASFLSKSRNVVGELLYVLHDENADALVDRVGFGNVAGFFVMRGIQFKAPTEAPVDTTGRAVNPVTGQRFSDERATPLAEMSREEKEREAERLFTLFDRLNRTGVVKVVNPLQQAVASGRFQQLDSSDDDDDDDDDIDDDADDDDDDDDENVDADINGRVGAMASSSRADRMRADSVATNLDSELETENLCVPSDSESDDDKQDRALSSVKSATEHAEGIPEKKLSTKEVSNAAASQQDQSADKPMLVASSATSSKETPKTQ